jgi:transcriptional regulator with XRE-family HTH domain
MKSLRVKNGITQPEMAKKLHISLRNFQRLESGEIPPTIENICTVANIFELGVEDLINPQPIDNLLEEIPKTEFLEHKFGSQLKEFIGNLQDLMKNQNGSDDILRSFLKDEKFQNLSFPCSITNFSKSVKNVRFSEIVGVAPHRITEGIEKMNTKMVLSWISKLFMKDEYYGKISIDKSVSPTDKFSEYMFVSFYWYDVHHIAISFKSS